MGKLSLAILLCAAVVYSQAAGPNKVSEGVRKQLAVPGAAAQVVVVFKDNESVYTQLRHQTFATKNAKYIAVVDTLKAFAASSQKSAAAILNASPRTASAYRTFWITNTMIIDAADAATIKHLTSLPEVLEVREPKVVSINPIVKGKKLAGEWGIEKTEADKVHAAGNTGEGIRVSNIDTGVRYTHEALEGNYQNDGFSWYDPYTNSRNPVDENGHGTHTMGTIAGGNGVGMAPGSTWIACRGCDTSSCTEAALTACGEFIACPHGPSSTDNCDVSKKPHVCSNSWGGGQGDNWYDAVIRAWIEVDIVPVFANGNDGQFGCGTASSPADSALNVIAVGSTDDTDSLSYFSSLGPTVSGEIKPDISAPGSDVRSAYNSADNSYESLSGTSMATPHVAGAVALLLSQETTLTFAQIKDRLYQNTEQSLGTGGGPCDGIGDKVFPNHSFGYGRLNILSAINA